MLNTAPSALAAMAGGVCVALVGAWLAARTPWRPLGVSLVLIGLGFIPSNVVTADDSLAAPLLFARAALMLAAAALFVSAADFVPVRESRHSQLHFVLFAAASIASLVALLRDGMDAAVGANTIGVTLVEFAVWAAGLRFLQRRRDEMAIGTPLRLLGLGCYVAMAFAAGADVAYGGTFEWVRSGAAALFVAGAFWFRAPVAAIAAVLLFVDGWASRLYLADAHTYLIGLARGLGLGIFVLGLWLWKTQDERERLARQTSNAT